MKVNIKTIIGLIIATLLLFSGTFGVNHYLKTTSDKMLTKVKLIETHISNNNLELARNTTIELSKEWEIFESKWTLLTNHHEIDNITTSLKNTLEFIKFNDVANSMANLEALRHYIEHIPSMEELNLKNIL